MSYYRTIEENLEWTKKILARAKEILTRGTTSAFDLPHLNTPIMSTDTFKLLENFVDEIERLKEREPHVENPE